MSDLSRSESYYRKICMEQHGYVPMQKEIKNRLGDALTKTFFESCLPCLKPYLGLSPTLEGPGDDLWVSPSDLLIGKVRLKPPLTSKHIKALTHQGILNIGQVVEEKYNREKELEKQRALEESEKMLRYMAEKEKIEAMAQVREEEKKIQEEVVAQLKLDFEDTLKEELKKLEYELGIEKDEAVAEGRKEVELFMQVKLEMAVLETVQRLTEQFAVELIKQSRCLHEHFWYHIKQQKHKLKIAILDEKAQCKEHLEKLRTEMQCENIANVMYVLAKERRRCSCEKQILEQNFIARLEELEKELEERGEKLQQNVSQLEKLGRELEAREAALFEIIKQFQKFIYFVLRAVPTQAEYLLNVEKLMIIELTKTVMETKPEFFQSERGSKSSSAHETFSGDVEGLVAEDFHECENYLKYIPSAQTLTTEEDFPAFSYDEKLYVREDFRNMISQGLKISRSNELWNFGVEDVVNLIQPTQVDETRRKSFASDRKSFVSVRFSKKGSDIIFEEQILQSHSYNVTSAIGESASIHSDSSGSLSSLSLTSGNKMPSKLELARDSLTLLKEKKETEGLNKVETEVSHVSKGSKVSKRSERADSLILTARRSVDSKISGTRDILSKNKESKIGLAVDSLTLLKRSTHSKIATCKFTKTTDYVKKREFVNIGIQVDNPLKTVQISHIDFIPNESNIKASSVVFNSRPKIIPQEEETSETIIPSKETIAVKGKSVEEVYGKTSELKVIGDRTSTAHLENQDVFTAKRVTSFIRILREQPSLLRLFTEVKNK